ncbi:hypothetical protein [Acholeplasma granularum]|uniref:hypothetical protein n=1 Tax=Acholeplasma granularum TaxID=264635 RepID=UPI00138AF955|nr:hypothetical protein [Acholeplasma granularum]
MKFILKLILNRFILSILIFFVFALDFNMLKLMPTQMYSYNRPPASAISSAYYEIELGAPKIYIEITYDENNIYLVPKSELSSHLTTDDLDQPLIAWYYYAFTLALVNIIPFNWFTRTKKSNKKQRK